ncbi:hypothetical protein ACFUCV_06750 [Specibacter sp. NPDC057265]|uniref:hypothetical protein n=1 Tax=Specibacter sp. NPDC057265 TaxID=3346075 RepID=UPI003642BD15
MPFWGSGGTDGRDHVPPLGEFPFNEQLTGLTGELDRGRFSKAQGPQTTMPRRALISRWSSIISDLAWFMT